MGRHRKSPLPRGISERARAGGRVYLLSFSDQHGTFRQELAGAVLEDAKKLLAQRRREVADGTYAPLLRSRSTLDAFAIEWAAYQRARGKRSVDDDETRYRLHIAPTLGRKALEEIKPVDVAALVESLKRGGELSAKSILNVHGVLSSMMELARFRELIVANPAKLPRGMLPTKKRGGGPRFERAEVEALLLSDVIPEHTRVYYAMQGLGGMRCGEASGRRWIDLDVAAQPLASLRVWSQYADQPLKTSRDDDTAERMVPVHPELGRILEAWRREGFARTYGRHPKPSDWICPDPSTGEPRTQAQAGNALRRDCVKLGIKARGTHAFRRACISIARSDGARADILERVTHNARGEMIDSYTSLEWASLCEAVSCLRIELRRAGVASIARAVASGSYDGSHDSNPQTLVFRGETMEVAGVEAASTPRRSRISEDRSRASCNVETGKSRTDANIPSSITGVIDALTRAAAKLRAAGDHEEAVAVETAIALLTP